MLKKSFNAKKEEVFKACKSVLKDLEIDINKSSLAEGYIDASTTGSLLSWGEDIEIEFVGRGSKTEVTVDSEASSQLWSWGKNSSNERNIINGLSKRLSK